MVVSRRGAEGAATFNFQRNDATMHSTVIRNFQKLAIRAPITLNMKHRLVDANHGIRDTQISRVVVSLR